jgi:MOSC domain-containing protein YiiM
VSVGATRPTDSGPPRRTVAHGRRRPGHPRRARSGGRHRAAGVGDGGRGARSPGEAASRSGSDLTLIEREALAAVEDDYDIGLEPGVHWRNLTTEGVALNHLVGERFRVGRAVCVGEELCEPCSYLERKLEREGIREALVHRGGLRAHIVEGGTVAVGNAVASVGSTD